jgi:hypothetical protein
MTCMNSAEFVDLGRRLLRHLFILNVAAGLKLLDALLLACSALARVRMTAMSVRGRPFAVGL